MNDIVASTGMSKGAFYHYQMIKEIVTIWDDLYKQLKA
jgi:hypothetical protein